MKIGIIGSSITCRAGNKPDEIINNINSHAIGPILNKNITAKVPGEIKDYPVYFAPIDNLDAVSWITNTLIGLLPKLPENINYQKTLLHTILGNNLFSEKFLKNVIINAHHSYAQMQISFSYDLQCLQNLANKLQDGEYETIIFGGIDSLINTATIHKLSEQKCLLTSFNSFGIIPGEAAAYVILQLAKDKTIIENISYELTNPPHLNNILLSLGAEANDPLVWHKITQKFWPSKTHKVPNTITTFNTLGEIGAATIPLYLALSTVLSGYSLIYDRQLVLITSNNNGAENESTS